MKYLVLFGILSLAIGCTSINVESIKDPDFTGTLEKMYILIHMPKLEVNKKVGTKPTVVNDRPTIETIYEKIQLSDLLAEIAASKFSEIGLDIKVKAFSGLVLNEDEAEKEISSFNPQGVMSITLLKYETIRMQYDFNIDVVYGVEIYHRELGNKKIWKSQIHALYVDHVPGSTEATVIIDNIIALMKKDGLVVEFMPIQ